MRDAPPGVTGKPVPPDISALAGAGTENGTWAVLGAHQGFWGGDRWRYTGVVGRISPRLDTYDASGNAYFFNLDGWTLYQELRRRLAHTDLFLGARYVFLDTTTRFEAGRRAGHPASRLRHAAIPDSAPSPSSTRGTTSSRRAAASS